MSSARSLWIIDPSVEHPEDQGVAEILAGWDGDHRLLRPALRPDDGPGPGTGYDAAGIVLMGSRASVTDGLPWIERLAAWTRPLLDGSHTVPLLGICFGHQLIAHLAGATVAPIAGGGKRAGVESTQLLGGSLLPGSRTLRVVVSHREEVKGCPAGYRVTARRRDVAIDGLEQAGRPVFSFQFHPEAREEFAQHAGIDAAQIDERVRDDCRGLLRAFLEQVGPPR